MLKCGKVVFLGSFAATQIGAFQIHEWTRAVSAAGLCVSSRQNRVKAVNAEPKRNDCMVAAPVSEKAEALVEDYDKLAKEMDGLSPLAIMDEALEKFGNDTAIAFSGAEDIALIECAQLTGKPFRVFSLDTGRLNPETYRFFDTVEKHYGIRIEYMVPDA